MVAHHRASFAAQSTWLTTASAAQNSTCSTWYKDAGPPSTTSHPLSWRSVPPRSTLRIADRPQLNILKPQHLLLKRHAKSCQHRYNVAESNRKVASSWPIDSSVLS